MLSILLLLLCFFVVAQKDTYQRTVPQLSLDLIREFPVIIKGKLCDLFGEFYFILNNNYYEIQMILNGEEDYCLACERTKAYWRSWFKGVWKSVIRKISGAIHACVSNEDIERSLLAFLKTEAKEWLRYVLALFQSDVNNLCTLFSLNPSTVHQRGKVMPICSECKGINSKTHAPGG